MIITIDGPSGTGKSSTARGVACRLGFLHVDTGAMYRAFAFWALKNRVKPDSEQEVVALLGSFNLHIDAKEDHKRYWVEDEEVTEAIRTREVTDASALIAVFPEVRKAIVARQRTIGEGTQSVFEGRDLGTVVFPKADIKIYLTARPQVRAKRRHEELVARDPDLSITLEQVLEDQEVRDRYDSTRKHSPLRPAKDAYILDTSDMQLDAVIDHLVEKIQEQLT